MGWYHVDRKGKGITLGYAENVHIDMEKLSKYLPDKGEAEGAFSCIPDALTKTYEDWPLLWKFAALDKSMRWKWESGHTENFEDYQPEILANAMHYCFEKKYGYPYDSFVSVSDYDYNVMIFCGAMWPPKEYSKNLAALTEEKLEAQLKEFISEVTDVDVSEMSLEVCEEYIKE